MNSDQKKTLSSWQSWLSAPSDALNTKLRWKEFELFEHPSVLRHILEGNLLALVIIELEKKIGRHEFCEYCLLAMSNIHDVPEFRLGDFNARVKRDRRVKEGLAEIEREFFEQYLIELQRLGAGEAAEKFMSWYDLLDKGGVETELFEGIELLGYFLFACREFARGNREIIEEINREAVPRLKQLGEKFGSLKIIYEPMLKVLEETL